MVENWFEMIRKWQNWKWSFHTSVHIPSQLICVYAELFFYIIFYESAPLSCKIAVKTHQMRLTNWFYICRFFFIPKES